MREENESTLAEIVQISKQYQRSIRVDIDFGRSDALEGYICHGTAAAVLDSMSKQLVESNQRAFTWTGPFGGGKSSLAVALASCLSRDRSLRTKARSILPIDSLPAFDRALPVRKGWLAVPVVGKRGSVVSALSNAFSTALGRPKDAKKNAELTATALIENICQEASRGEHDGVFIVLDEMGKFLEAAALGMGDDVYFFQELAEAAARASGKVVIIGVLHQSFGQYANRLGIDTRDDWSKIQGRYADIPLVAASDEVVELVGRAISVATRPSWTLEVAEIVAESIHSRRPAVGREFGERLAACWPLHPAIALLGPISKRQFGQNERSTFGFLASAEPNGFRSYLETTTVRSATWYRPCNYWDYLRSNLEPAILASSDGHRWAQAVEAVERTEAKSSDPMLIELVKSIAIIDLFRNGSGLTADSEVFSALFYKTPKNKIEAALEQLAQWRVILFKRHVGAWSVFEGSDFDIDAAINQTRSAMAGVDFALLTSLSNMHPVVAKRHYHETGTMRWMTMRICMLDEAKRISEGFVPQKGEFGAFLLALPGKNVSPHAAQEACRVAASAAACPVAVGVPPNYARLADLGAEMLALQAVQSRHELSGDAVARREVQARLSSVRANIEEQLRSGVAASQWLVGNEETYAGVRLSPIASSLADKRYPHAPAVWSELVNRDNLSSNSVKARRDLLYRMLDNEKEQNLGIIGYPADRGLYETLLRSTGLHRVDKDGVWGFYAPTGELSSTFVRLWEAARLMFENGSNRIQSTDIHALWAAPPFGVRKGVVPVLLVAFLLAHKGNVALYKDGIFIPRLTDADIDEYLQDERRFSLRWVLIDDEKGQILEGISSILEQAGLAAPAHDPLEAARGLVSLVFGLPVWAQRTHRISDRARSVRDTLLKASDPHKVLFVDLAAIFGTDDGESYVESLRAPIIEIAGAYDALLREVESSMLVALDAGGEDLGKLRTRAEALSGMTGDLRQDAFSARLAKHDGRKESVEGILSLAVNKPTRDWTDRDVDAAMLEISRFALRFRQTEAFSSVRGRQPKSEAFAVVIGTGAATRTVSREFAVSERHRTAVDNMTEELVAKMRSAGLSVDTLLAVLARTGLRLVTEDEQSLEHLNGG
jgi:hypothetical protein